MASDSVFPTVFSQEASDDFVAQVLEDWGLVDAAGQLIGPGITVEHQDLQAVYTLGAADVGNDQTPLVVDILQAAYRESGGTGPRGAGPTDDPAVAQPSWITSNTPDPKLDGKPLPDTVAVLIGAIAVRVDVPPVTLDVGRVTTETTGTYTIDAAIADALHGIQHAFDASVLEVRNAQNLVARVAGMLSTSYGSSRVALITPPVVETESLIEPIYSGQQLLRDRGWTRLSRAYVLGSQQQLAIRHTIPRSNPWPLRPAVGESPADRIRVTVSFPGSLVARRDTGKGTGGMPRRAIASRC